jgi:ABC transporter DrrB family efflux protein
MCEHQRQSSERGAVSDSARAAIEVQGISKSFGRTLALSDVSIRAQSGRILALLGPNGAGKTTLVRILTTLLQPDAGWAEVTGFDVVKDADSVRSVIGLTGQFAAVDLMLTGRENLEMVGDLCHLSRAQSKARAGELLDQLALADAAERLAKTYSGGMRRRLDLAASLIAKPPVLVLDEPTTGLDPRTRVDVWKAVQDLVADGTTVLLTTQYLEEADHLAHRIALMDRGRIVAEGTSKDLKAQLGGDVLEVQLESPEELGSALSALSGMADVRTIDAEDRRIALPAPDGVATLRTVLDQLDRAEIHVDDIGIRHPSLDDVFLSLTGRSATEDRLGSPEPSEGEPASSIGVSAIEAAADRSNGVSGDAVADQPHQRPTPSSPATRRGPSSSAVRDTLVIVKRNLRRIRRTPRLLLVSSIQPVLFVLAFRYVFGGSLRIPHESYIDYLLPGAFVTGTLMGATTAVAMATDLAGGMVERFRSLPIARSAVLAGRCVADLMRSTLVVAIVLVVGLILGFRFHNEALPAVGAFALVLAAGFAFIWLYALIGLLVKDPESAQLAGLLAMMPFVFGSSAFVRVENMPGWMQVFARNQPVSVTVDAVRSMCEGGPIAPYLLGSIAWIVGLTVASGWLAVASYRRL